MSTEATRAWTQAKLWGETRQIFLSAGVELHHASIKAGGYSSRHHHQGKDNLFYVAAGKLLVHRYDPDEAPVLLQAGEWYTAEAGRDHRFEAGTDVELIELYVPAADRPRLFAEDIVRRDVGGLDTVRHT